jgi:transposase
VSYEFVRALRGDGGGANQHTFTTQGTPLKNARERMDVIAAYREVGSYRGAAEICGTTHKTVKRIIEAHDAGNPPVKREPRPKNYDQVTDLVAEKVKATSGRISAKRLLPLARAAGYAGSDRNFRRLVAAAKKAWRREHPRGRRPAVWAPGETLVIDWGVLDGLHVFCAVLAWSRFRFVRFAADEKAATTLALLAECFEVLGGVPNVVLADRMGCLKGGVVANVVVPSPDYVRFASHYRFRPDFCEAADPESKGIVENLVGYAKADLMIPLSLSEDQTRDLAAANAAAAACARRSTPRSTRRSARSRSTGWPPNAICWVSCRRCGQSLEPGRSLARSTSCPASGSARAAIRSPTP